MLEKRSLSYVDGPIPVPIDDALLADNVQSINICDTGVVSFTCILSMSITFFFL